MSKELQAFRKICKNLNSYEFTDEYKKNKKLIETALKELEVKRDVIGDILTGDDEKKLKALEIIKEKEVNVFIFLHSGDLETYNDMVEDNRKLKQEEYEILKEILK